MNVGSLAGAVWRQVTSSRLEAFGRRTGEVPAESQGEMKYALAELTTNILWLVGIQDVDCSSRPPQENIAHAVEVLRGDRPIVAENANVTFEEIGKALSEMFAGLRASNAGK